MSDLPFKESQTAIISENLKRYRLIQGLRQEELCAGICSVSQLSKIETGKAFAKPDQLQAFAQRLGVKVEELCTQDAYQVRVQELFRIAQRADAARMTERSLAMTQQVIEQCQLGGYTDLYLEASCFQAQLLVKLCRWAEAIALLTERLESDVALEPHRLVELWGELGFVQLRARDQAEARRCFLRVCEYMPQIAPHHPRALTLYYRFAQSLYELGNYREAYRSAKLAKQLAETQSKHRWRLRSDGVLALAAHALGEKDLSYALLESNLKEAEENQIASEVGEISVNLGMLYHRDGDLTRARMFLERGIKHLELVGDDHPYPALLPLLELAEVELEDGRPKQAEDWLNRVEQLLSSLEGATYRYEAKAQLIHAGLAARKGDEAGSLYHQMQALAIYERHNAFFEGYETAVEIAQVLEKRAKEPDALEMYRRAIRLHRKFLVK